jgi:hypothetical protein
MRISVAVLLVGLVACGQAARAQQEDRSTQKDEQPQQQRGQPRDAARGENPLPGVDREAAISHALCMAIEGSGLWFAAKEAEASPRAGAAANRPGEAPDTVGALGQHARDAFQASSQLFQAVRQDKNAGNQPNANRDDANANARIDAQAGNQSDRDRACQAFYQASWEYSRLLESLCDQTVAGARPEEGRVQPAQPRQPAEAANLRAEGAIRQPAGGMPLSSQDMARVALINHAVKEGVEGVNLRTMIRHHGAQDEASQALLSHADQMLASSRRAIQSIGQFPQNRGGADTDRDRGAAATDRPAASDRIPNPAVTTPRIQEGPQARQNPAAGAQARGDIVAPNPQVDHLARLGRQVIDAVQALEPEGQRGAGQRRDTGERTNP